MTLYRLGLASIFALLGGCHDHTKPVDDTNQAQSFEELMATKLSDDIHSTVREGIMALRDGNYEVASQHFNLALMDDPSNSFLHYVNGLAYHSMARKGDVVKYDLAQSGFEQAIKFNSSNHLACLQLARVKYDKKDYLEAQEQYAGALLLKPDNADALFELANASYYLGDLKNAQMGINRALKKLGQRPEVHKAAVMIFAAAGKHDKAREHFTIYQQLTKESHKAQYTMERAQNWQDLYQKGIVLAQADPQSQSGFATENPDAPADAPADQAAPAPASSAPLPGQDEMIVVDAVTMRISESGGTSKGNNLLDNFALTISPGSHFYARGNNGAITAGQTSIALPGVTPTYTPTGVQGNPGTLGSTRLFAQGLSFSAIQYGLNIFNASREYIEVVGRPSLVTSVGSAKPAQFFSGDHLALGLAPQIGGAAGSITQLPVGITLEVNAVSLKDGFVTLEIKLYGSIVNNNDLRKPDGTAANPTLQFTRIGLSKVVTRVKIRLGETIMLAGVTERIESQDKSGVPVLQDIFFLQYFFSRENTSSVRKSVVYLLTPRSYEANKNAIKGIVKHTTKPNMKELELRHVDWYDPDYNMVVTFKHLMPMHREFRHGDLDPLRWSMKQDHESNVAQALAFLYY